MFASFRYPSRARFGERVAADLLRMGWARAELADAERFGAICAALEARGMSPAEAARLWHGALAGEAAALRELEARAGIAVFP